MSDEQNGEALRMLPQLVGASSVESVCRLGRTVVELLYGDIERWRGRTRGDLSYARIERHPLLAKNAAKIYRAVRVYEMCERLPTDVVEGLSLSHLLVALAVEPDQQALLLRSAKEQGWSVRRLKTAVAQDSASAPSTGRPRTPAVIRTLRFVLATDGAFEGTDSLLTLGGREARSLFESCRRAQRELARVEKHLAQVPFHRKRTSVLLVDAAPSFTLRAQRQLRRQGCRVRVVESAAAAREAVDATTDCCIIDPALPDGSGLELAEELSGQYPQLTYIFVTDRSPPALPPRLAESRWVAKASGLWALRVAVATAVASVVTAL